MKLPGSPGTATDRADALEEHRVVGHGEAGVHGLVVGLAKRRDEERLRGLRDAEVLARHGVDHAKPVEPLDRVGDRHDGDGAVDPRRDRAEPPR